MYGAGGIFIVPPESTIVLSNHHMHYDNQPLYSFTSTTYCTHIHTDTRTRTGARARARAHTHTHTHTHTHKVLGGNVLMYTQRKHYLHKVIITEATNGTDRKKR